MHSAIEIRHDKKRGCGFRKMHGIYLVSGGLSAPCSWLPKVLDRCPCCDNGIKPSLGWTWVNGNALLLQGRGGLCGAKHCQYCPVSQAKLEKSGLLWVGGMFYATADQFMCEAAELGVSRRIQSVPRDFKLGETWMLLAHRQVPVGGELKPAVFSVFQPERIECVVSGEEPDEYIENLVKRGITPVLIERVEEPPVPPKKRGPKPKAQLPLEGF